MRQKLGGMDGRKQNKELLWTEEQGSQKNTGGSNNKETRSATTYKSKMKIGETVQTRHDYSSRLVL